MRSSEEVVIPFSLPAARLRPVGEVRTTLITSSLQSLRERRYLDAYCAALPPELHDSILTTVAGAWMPIATACAHYAACDALQLSDLEREAIGAEVGTRVSGTFLGTLVRGARGAGLTPWLGFQQYARLWGRIFRGGDVAVFKIGPKDARLEVLGLPLARYHYFRAGFRGVNRATCALFAETVFVHQVPRLCTDSSLGFKISWA
ncbi:MAG: hypothetical protein NVSMB47_16180 [Polyangiales bacterium]